MASLSAPAGSPANNRPVVEAQDPLLQSNTSLAVLIVVPTLDGGAADAGAVELVRILSRAGRRAVVASRAGRLVPDVTAAGGEFVALDVSSKNPVFMLRNAIILTRLARERR